MQLTRSLADSALVYLSSRPGEKVRVQELAVFYDCHETTVRKALNKLVGKRLIKSERVRSTVYYMFDGEPQPKAEPRQSPISHKVYSLPSVMAERGREIAAHRENNPSYFGHQREAIIDFAK